MAAEQIWAPIRLKKGRTRDGRMVDHLRRDLGGDVFPWRGEVFAEDGRACFFCRWTDQGRSWNAPGSSAFDLVAEWTDAAPASAPINPMQIMIGDELEVRKKVICFMPDSGFPIVDGTYTGIGLLCRPEEIVRHIPKGPIPIEEGATVITRDGVIGTAGKPMDGVVLVKSRSYEHPIAWPVDKLQVQLRPGQTRQVP